MSDEPKSALTEAREAMDSSGKKEAVSSRKKATSVSEDWQYVSVYWVRDTNPVLGWVPKDWWRRHIRGNRERVPLSPIPSSEPDMLIDGSFVIAITALDWTTGERRGCVKESKS